MTDSRAMAELRRQRIVALMDEGHSDLSIAERTGSSYRLVRRVTMATQGQRAACTHDWDGGTLIRRCLRRYVCRTCGARQTIDSGD